MDVGTEKLYDTAIKAHDVLFTAKSVFPFMLIPDTITLDREKVTIVHRSFIKISTITSIQVKDILIVQANTGPFFGSIHLTSRYFINNPQKLNFLPRSHTIKLQRLIQGYIIATQKEIDCSDIDKEELIVLLDDLGQGITD